jgi:hypothetical protein
MRFTMLDNEIPNRGCDLNHNEDPDVLQRARQYNEEVQRAEDRRNADAFARFEAARDRWDVLASGWCPSCNTAQDSVDEQYSFGVYAGIMCTACAIRGFRDGCGHLDGRQGNAAELDEPMGED